MSARLRLGVNVDHVATIRQARGTLYPDPVQAGLLAAKAGADSITIHLREDRRHIQEHDVERMIDETPVPVNLEMAVTPEMVRLACAARPHYCCLVPERRQELTTEGGLDVKRQLPRVRKACAQLAEAGIAVALFVDPDLRQLEACRQSGAPHVEIHTGAYAEAARDTARARELRRVTTFAAAAARAGLEVHAGHGLNLHNVAAIAAVPEVVELNIGHSIVARALYVGFQQAVKEMREAMGKAKR